MSEFPSHDAAPSPIQDHVLPFAVPAWLAWSAAVICFFAAVFFAAKSFNVRGELQASLDAERVARFEAGTLKNLLEAERILSRGQLDRLLATERQIGELSVQADVSRLTIASLTAPEGQAPDAHAIAVWNPDSQQGLLVVSLLEPLPEVQDYQLWIIDPQDTQAQVAGVFSVDPGTGEARVVFKTGTPIRDAQDFIVTREPVGGSVTAPGLIVLSSRQTAP